jgi:hypothetical protein
LRSLLPVGACVPVIREIWSREDEDGSGVPQVARPLLDSSETDVEPAASALVDAASKSIR